MTHLSRSIQRALRWGFVGVATVLALLVVAIGLLQIDAITTIAVRAVAGIAAPPGARVTVGRASGSIVGTLGLDSVTVVRPGSDTAVVIDRLRLRYDLTGLLHHQLVVRDVVVDRPEVRLYRRADSAWALLPTATGESTPSAPSRWSVTIDRIVLDRGMVQLASRPDSVDIVRGIVLRGHGVSIGAGPAFTIDSLSATVVKAGLEQTPGILLAAGRWGPDGIEVDTLSIHTPGSRITASGTIVLGEHGEPAAGSRFVAVAEPLALDEITPFVPGIGGPPIRVRIDTHSEGPDRLRWSVTARGVKNAAVDLAGRVEWRGDTLQGISVAGTVGSIDPASLSPAVTAPGSLGGRLTADLHGPDPTRWSGTARLDLDPSSFGATTIRDGAVRATADSGLVKLHLGAIVNAFRVVADGDVGLREQIYSVKGEVRSENRLQRAIIVASGKGLPPSGTGRFDLRADSIRFGKTAVAAAHLDGVLVRDSVAARLSSEVAGGVVSARLAARPFDDHPWVRAFDGRLTGIDLRSLGGAGPASRINGRFSAAIAEFDPATTKSHVELAIDSSVVGRQIIANGRLSLAVADGRVDATGNVVLPNGSLELEAFAFPLEEPIRYTVKAARFQQLDVAAWMGRTDWRTSLTGALSLQGTGVDPGLLSADGRIDLDPSTINSGPVAGHLVWKASGGRITGESHLTLAGGATSAAGTVTVGEPLTYQLRAAVAAPALGPLLGRPAEVASLDGDLELAGRGTERSTVEGRLTVNLRSGAWAGVKADSGRVVVQASQGAVHADTVWLRTNAGAIEGGGVIPLVAGAPPADFKLRARIETLDPFETLRPGTQLSLGSSVATVAVTGPADSLVVTADGRVDALAVGAIRLVGFTGTAEASLSWDHGLETSQARLELDHLLLPTAAITQITLDQRYRRGDELTLETKATIDGRRTFQAAVRLDPAAPEPWWTIDQAQLQSGETRWTLARPARFRYRPSIAIDSLVLSAPGRVIAINGGIDPDGKSDLHVAVDSFPVGTIADLVGYPRLDGALTSRIDLTGAGADLRGRAQLDFVLSESPTGPGAVHVEARLHGDSIEVTSEVDQRSARVAELTGTVVRARGDRPTTVDLRLRADSFAVASAQSFVDPGLAEIQNGRLSGEVRVRGSPGAAELAGQLQLSGGRVKLPRYGVTYRDVDIVVGLERSELRVVKASLRSGGGTLQAHGVAHVRDVDLADLDLSLTADGFQAVQSDQMRAVVSGNLSVHGTTRAPAVTGEVSILRGELDLAGVAGGQVEKVELTDADYKMLESYLGFAVQREGETLIPTLEATTLDLTVKIGRDSWLQQHANPELAVQLSGQIRVRKQPGHDLQFVGELDPIPARSHVEQFGRRFELREGSLRFAGGPLDTKIDIEAQYTVPSRDHNEPEVVIVLGVEGKVGDLKITLSSEPTMDNADIVSYIATGRPAASALDVGGGGGGNGLATAGAGLALDRATGLVESVAKQQIGLDVIEVRREGLDGATLVAGRYVSPTLYLGFKQPITLRADDNVGTGQQGQTEVEIELQAYRWLLLNFQGGGAALQFFLRARHEY